MSQTPVSKTRISEAYAQIEEKVPEFLSMSSDQLIEWCIMRYERLKATQGLTHQALADEANMPKGTVDRLLAGNYRDFKYSTIQPLIAAMLRQHDPIPEIEPEEASVEDAQELLEGYQMTLHEKNQQIPQLLDHIVRMEDLHTKAMNDLREDSQKKVDYLKQQIARKDKAISILSLSLAAVALFVIVILIYDKTNPDIGWFRDAALLMIPWLS